MPDPSFEALLNTQVEDAERPPPMPEGTWTFQIKTHRHMNSSRKGTPGVEFEVTPTGWDDDVDADEVAAYTEKVDLKEKKIAGNDTTFWITKDALPMLRDFLEKMGLDTNSRTFKQCLPDTTGCQVKGLVRHNPGDDGNTYANIVRWAPAE